METRLQARVEAFESRLSSVETRVQDLLQVVGTLHDTMVREKQEQSEFRALFRKFLKDHGRRLTGEGDEVQNTYEELASLRQQGSVQEYIEEFEILAALVPHQPEQQYVGYFLNGLKVDIHSWVRIHNLDSRLKAMQLAHNIELALHKEGERTLRSSMGRAHANHWINVGRGPASTKFREEEEDEALTTDEQVNALEVEGEEEGVEAECSVLTSESLLELFELNKIERCRLKTLKLTGKGDGCRVLAKGPCSGVEVVIGNYHCSVDAWVMELGGVDLILGVVWLKTLGDRGA
ncbi:Retrotransposon gag domain [Sesbania bispinosa]|nr:Retrotransposon gag domain [Sesbania bispinosa]